MTDQQAALALDRALDGERGFDLNGSQPLLATAETVQTLFDRQQGTPTEDFLMQLEQQLFPSVENPALSTPSPAPALPVRRPTSIDASRERRFPHMLAAIAAALVLLFGGAGAIIFDGFGLRDTPEPSAIPAVAFGTVEASPVAADGPLWTVAPPDFSNGTDKPGVIGNGIMFQSFMTYSDDSPIQAVDLATGNVLWQATPVVAENVLAVAGDDLLVGGSDGIRWQLLALDGRTGAQRSALELEQRPVALRVSGGQVLVLGSGNLLQAIDLASLQPIWETDLSQYDDAPASYDGQNAFGDFAGERLAMSNGTLGAIVGNGRLIGIDANDGTVRWADDRTTAGWTRVKVVDGNFVVIAFGGDTLMYDPEATPLPATPAAPTVDPCTLTISARVGSTPETASGAGETVDSFDPATGESPWGLFFPEQYSVWPLDDSQLLSQVESVESAGIADSGDLFPCVIDGATGAVSEADPTALATFVIVDGATGARWGIATLPDGASDWLGELDPETADLLPQIEMSAIGNMAPRWSQYTDGLILITGQDGSLTAFADRE